MNKIALLMVLLLMPSLVSAGIESINYPAPNDVIPETKNIRLNLTSSLLTENCTFSYDGIRNQTVACNGISRVDLPNADGAYQIKVTDGSGNSIGQYVFIEKPTGVLVLVIYGLSYFLIFGIVVSFLRLLLRLLLFKIGLSDMLISLGLYFLLLFDYQLVLEYINIPFLVDWLDLLIDWGGWISIIFALLFWIICVFVRAGKKKTKGNIGEEFIAW